MSDENTPIEPAQEQESTIPEPEIINTIPEAAEISGEASPEISAAQPPNTVTITEIMSPPETPRPEEIKEDKKSFLASLLPKLKEKLLFRTEKRLSKILELAREKGEIKNDDVEKLLHVSHTTAFRYLKKLVERGHLKASGSPHQPTYLP